MWSPPKKLRLFFPCLFLLYVQTTTAGFASICLRCIGRQGRIGLIQFIEVKESVPGGVVQRRKRRPWKYTLEGFPTNSPATPPPQPQDAGVFRHFFRVWRFILHLFLRRESTTRTFFFATIFRHPGWGGSDPTNTYKNPKERSRKGKWYVWIIFHFKCKKSRTIFTANFLWLLDDWML